MGKRKKPKNATGTFATIGGDGKAAARAAKLTEGMPRQREKLIKSLSVPEPEHRRNEKERAMTNKKDAIDRLEELAKKATPGRWERDEDVAYIVAANPATILELIQRLRKAEETLSVMEEVESLMSIRIINEKRRAATSAVNALREAAAEAPMNYYDPRHQADWLRARADALEQEELDEETTTERHMVWDDDRTYHFEPDDTISVPAGSNARLQRILDAAHVPHGPATAPEHITDASYLRSATDRLRHGHPVGDKNLAATVVAVLEAVANELDSDNTH